MAIYSDENPPNGGVECRWGRQKSQLRHRRDWPYSLDDAADAGQCGMIRQKVSDEHEKREEAVSAP